MICACRCGVAGQGGRPCGPAVLDAVVGAAGGVGAAGAIKIRKPDVQQHDVRVQRADCGDGSGSGAGLPHHVESVRFEHRSS